MIEETARAGLFVVVDTFRAVETVGDIEQANRWSPVRDDPYF
jgi:hypothetical protein